MIAFRSGGTSDRVVPPRFAQDRPLALTGPGSARLRPVIALAITLLFLTVVLPLHSPLRTAQAGDPVGGRLYPETGHTLAQQFVNFYDGHGGVPIFGYPVSDARMENGFLVQWTERQRLEWHPEQAGTEYEVQLGLLGRELTHRLNGPNFQPVQASEHQQLGGPEATQPPVPPAGPGQTPDPQPSHYFPETGQYVADLFYDYWVHNGGLRVFGYPISVTIAACGLQITDCRPGTADNQQLLQWFERARFEVHPANPPETRVLLGHLGYEALKARRLADYKFQVYPAQPDASGCCPIRETSAPQQGLQIGLAQGGESDDPGFFDNIKDAGSALGPGLVRLDNIFNFYNIVQRGPDGAISYNWQQLDRELDAVRAMKKEPLITLSYMPETMSATGNSRVLPPANYDEWAALVRATVTHINVDRCKGPAPCPNRVTYWEVWNEPNLWSFWQAPYPDYLKLYDATVQAALAADPTIKIGGPAVSYFSTDHLGEFLEHERWQVLAGAPVRVDFISWHSYGKSADQVAADIRRMRKILEGYPQFNPQLFITEFNVLQGGSGDTSANGYSDTVEGAIGFVSSIESMQRERLDRAFLFEMKDGPPPVCCLSPSAYFWGRWGILTFGGQPKPVYYALKAFQNRPPAMMPVSLLAGPADGSLGMMAFTGAAQVESNSQKGGLTPTGDCSLPATHCTAGRATLLLWYTGPDEARVKVALPPDFDDTDFDVTFFDHDTNNPARAANERPVTTGGYIPPSSNPSAPPSAIPLTNAGDLVFDLKPESLVIITSR